MYTGSTKKIVIVSSGQPSLNPRMVKEADALAGAGYVVTVLYSYRNEWATRTDKQLLASKSWKGICVGGNPKDRRLTYILSSLIHRIARIINGISGGRYAAEFAISRTAHFLSRSARKYRADIYIGHNLGALRAVYLAAKKHHRPWGFDLEDFHRHEVSDDLNAADVRLKKTLEDRYLPKSDYLTASSPLIVEAYEKLFLQRTITCVRNVFPVQKEIAYRQFNRSQPIRLLWLSQTIGPKRGLEDIISALQICAEGSFELHLLGDISDETKARYLNPLMTRRTVDIRFHSPVGPDELITVASAYDIGLALEPGFSANNNLALSNKIFTYMNAGLAVIASDTDAQSKLIREFPDVGSLYARGNVQELADILIDYYNNRDKLISSQKASLAITGEILNWENESQKFLVTVEKAIGG